MTATPRTCSLLGRVWSAIGVDMKAGFSIEAGKYLSYDASVNWAPATNLVMANLGGSLMKFGTSAQRTLSYGDTIIGPEPNPTFTVETPVSSTDLITGKTTPSASHSVKVGGAFVVGADLSFDSESFESASAACGKQ